MDVVLCSVQTGTQESQASRSRSLRVRLGVVGIVAIVIEYYVPRKLQKTERKMDSARTARGDHSVSGA